MMQKGGNKEAFALALDFFKGNITLSLLAIGILIAVALLQMVPIVGIVFSFAYPILSLAVQVYVGRLVTEVDSEEQMSREAARSTLNDLFVKHIDIATGAVLGFMIIAFLFGLIFFFLLGSSFNATTVQQQNMEAFFASLNVGMAMGTMLFALIISMIFAYLTPGVLGRVILAEDFGDAFRKSLLFFSPSFWKQTFNKDYFVLVFIWSIVVFVAALVISWLMASILLAPVALIALYCLSLYNAAVYVFAERSLKQ
ncbi:hypothetical protein [Nitratifractor sp.]